MFYDCARANQEECLVDVHTGALVHVHMCRCSLRVGQIDNYMYFACNLIPCCRSIPNYSKLIECCMLYMTLKSYTAREWAWGRRYNNYITATLNALINPRDHVVTNEA